MPNLFTIAAGLPIAERAAAHVLASVPQSQLARCLLLLPTRRACVTMRQAFQAVLCDQASLLPRMVPLADIDAELLTVLGPRALPIIETIHPAMPAWQQRYLLTKLVASFERRRLGAVSLDYALAMTEELMKLQDQCARAGVTLTLEKLRPLVHANFATHWEQSLQFLAILAEQWPAEEAELGLTIRPCREVKVLHALAAAWAETPPDFRVFAIGSTASQEATAQLLKVIADMENGTVILPGLDTSLAPEPWATIAAGHPMFHLKQFLDRWPLLPGEVANLGEAPRSLWHTALTNTADIPTWKNEPLPPYEHIKLIPCAHPEEEVRVISLLLREALEHGKRTALITPDEGLMARVAAHMKRYEVTVDRLNAGTIGATQAGSLWMLAANAIAEPGRLLHLRSLLHHPLMAVDGELLTAMEPYWYGVGTQRPGQLPRLPEALRAHAGLPPIQQLVRSLGRLSRARLLPSAWVEQVSEALDALVPIAGQGQEALSELLTTLSEADLLGPMEIAEFNALLFERLAEPWRDAGLRTHPQLFMLTPVEARLQQFDRVILANLQDAQWPGIETPNAWMNLAAQTAVGLPAPEERVSLMAHDMLMLGSGADVFLTWPRRDGGSPATRSRFIERLVTLLAMHGGSEGSITASHYVDWANARDAADHYAPAQPVMPRPTAAQRPRMLPVSALDKLFTDPFAIYARHVLGLKPWAELDAELEASDFGNLAHRAIMELSKHWNETSIAADEAKIADIADHALRDFSDRPNVALFWRRRLIRALQFVNGQESARRLEPLQVLAEMPLEAEITLGDDAITLQGRLDRLEEGAGGTNIIDYKTGNAPTRSEILNGRALQLLAYAMMVESLGGNVAQLEYWKLPHGPAEGEIRSIALAELAEANLPEQLREALALMLQPQTPFLARTASDDRFENDYDGISRYDEWAG